MLCYIQSNGDDGTALVINISFFFYFTGHTTLRPTLCRSKLVKEKKKKPKRNEFYSKKETKGKVENILVEPYIPTNT